MEQEQPGYYVAIIGGAVAGSEAAEKLSQRKIRCVVFDQYALPYGKIETGLPKWHIKLRNSQELKIDQKLNNPLVDFVPHIRLGKEIHFKDLAQNWGFSAILLATGAWRDRPLGLPGIEQFLNEGVYYQNPFVAWFNRKHDPTFKDARFQILDNSVIIGGGLASFDVVKIVMLELVQQALEERQINSNILTLEKLGIPRLLQERGLAFSDLNIKGCTLCYRRAITDMPLTNLPVNPTGHEIETAHRVRQKIFDNMQSKYLFRFKECHTPVDMVVEEGRLEGFVFQKTKIEDGRVKNVPDGMYEIRASQVISAIGSLPEHIDGLPMKGDVYDVVDAESGRINGYSNVFALGNAVTGRGNIKESEMHGRQVSEKIMDEYLSWREEDYEEIFKRAEENAEKKIELISSYLRNRNLLGVQQINALRHRVKNLQNKAGYNGDYAGWIKEHLPVRLENLIDYKD